MKFLYFLLLEVILKWDYVQNKDIHNHDNRQPCNYHASQHRLNSYSKLSSLAGAELVIKLPHSIKTIQIYTIFNSLRQTTFIVWSLLCRGGVPAQ